ncbi:MAG TPA: hypothetical protein VN841_26605 [Bryobacteraceae bacterium]|nr:hypothetical protein [Bryobacteraceae bacterium]
MGILLHSRLLLLLSFAVSAGAQAILTYQIANNYNFIQPGLPNYGIAQGSIFALQGTSLAASRASQGVPLQTDLGGTEIAVTVNGTTTNAIPYYVSPQQITAILPSKTPVGDGTVTVTSGGKQTASGPIHVVQSAFGLLTLPNLNVLNVAQVQDASQGGKLLSLSNAANPGEFLTLWGSGLGPVSGDETQYQTPGNLTGPIEVDIGGVPATVTYHGRSIYPGLDQINVIVPSGISGCSASLVVVAGGVPSNVATVPVPSSGRICSDPELIPLTPDEYQGLLSLDNVNTGFISLVKLTTANAAAGSTTSDSANAVFQSYTSQQATSAGFLPQTSIGSCITYIEGGPPPYFTAPVELNAGPQINVSGPDGLLALVRYAQIYPEPPDTSPPIIPPTGGTFTFDNGSGGPDVGPFTASLTVNLANPLVWTNGSAITAINRASGQQITWTGGIPGSYVSIYGYTFAHEYSPAANGSDVYTYLTCSAPISAGQFTIPAAVLESLMPSGTVLGGGLPPAGNGYLFVVNQTVQQFQAPGMDLGLILFGAGSGISVPFN